MVIVVLYIKFFILWDWWIISKFVKYISVYICSLCIKCFKSIMNDNNLKFVICYNVWIFFLVLLKCIFIYLVYFVR